MGKLWANFFLILPLLAYFFFGNTISANSAKSDEIRGVGYQLGLDRNSATFLHSYGATLRKYSQKYGFDWRLMMAIMRAESRFHPKAESHRGAEGLMQIMPVTQSQIADELGFSENDFQRPHTNIRGGIYYLGKIYRSFDRQGISKENRLRLTLAAYNAGTGRIADAQAMARYMNDNPNEWNSVKSALSLLSRKYSSLHQNIWETGRPSSGYYRQWRQTTGYVESVMSYYAEYCRIIPENV
jgi:membrane-bound lytic murein transglycosylase F